MESDTLTFDDIVVDNEMGKTDTQTEDTETENFVDAGSVEKTEISRIQEMENRFLGLKRNLEDKLKETRDDFKRELTRLSESVDEKFNRFQKRLDKYDERMEQRIGVLETKVEAHANNKTRKVVDGGASGDAPGAGGEPATADTAQGNTPSSPIVTGALSKTRKRTGSPEKESQKFMDNATSTIEDPISSSLELRVEALEVAVQKALHTLFPRVENLLQQFETKAREEEMSEYSAAAEEATPEMRRAAEEDPMTASTPRPLTACSTQSVCATPSPKSQRGSKQGDRGSGSAEGQRRLNFHFIQASKRGCVHEIRYYHDLGADVNARDHHGKTALHHAVGAEAVAGAAAKVRGAEAVAFLLSIGADVGARAGHGWTPLHDAARAGHAPHVEALVQRGADTAAEDEYGYTALHWAAFKGRLEVASTLLNQVDERDIRAGRATATTAMDKRGRMPLFYAAQQGHTRLVVILTGCPDSRPTLDHRDCDGSTALHAAAAGGQEGAVNILLSAGASITIKDKLYRTALDVAKNEAIRKLIKNGPT